jgi:hypothetical protein
MSCVGFLNKIIVLLSCQKKNMNLAAVSLLESRTVDTKKDR